MPSISITSAFLDELLETGAITVAPFAADAMLTVDDSAHAAMREWDATTRLDLMGDAPPFDVSAAAWGLSQLYRFAQLLVCRDTPSETVVAAVTTKYPNEAAAAVIYSADLFLQYVPRIYRRANDAAPGDPLVSALKTWAADWPLSSVGIPLERLPRLGAIAERPTLWRLYVDRVASEQAADRWAEPAVAMQLRADIGAFPDLAPAIARALSSRAPISR